MYVCDNASCVRYLSVFCCDLELVFDRSDSIFEVEHMHNKST